MRLLLRLARALDDVADHRAHLLQRARGVGVGRVEVDPAGLVLVDDVALLAQPRLELVDHLRDARGVELLRLIGVLLLVLPEGMGEEVINPLL